MKANTLPDLDQLDNEALKALAIELQMELRQQRETAAQQESELAALEAEFATQRLKLTEQSEELRTRSDQIEHLKLLVEKLRRTIFGKKSEKIVAHLEQLELELEELETAQAATETIAGAVGLEAAPQARPRRKPLPEHLRREDVTHTPEHACCPDCGGSLKRMANVTFHLTASGPQIDRQCNRDYSPMNFRVGRLWGLLWGESTREEWDRVIGINLRGVWSSMKYELRQMEQQGSGAIVNNASVGSLTGNPGIGSYIASKHGVVGLTRTAAHEYIKKGIYVNAVNLGVISEAEAQAQRTRPRFVWLSAATGGVQDPRNHASRRMVSAFLQNRTSICCLELVRAVAED